MVRIILGVIAGFLAWSIVWIGGQSVLSSLSPDWIGRHFYQAEAALVNGEAFRGDTSIELINLLRSFVTSLIAGYMAALVAGEYRRSTVALGVVLTLVGISVQILAWNLAPVWYHIVFIIGLLPMTVLGGRLRRSS